MVSGIMLMITAAAAALSLAACQTRQFHMLQQSSYYASRYLEWVKTAFSYRAACSAAVFAVSLVLFFSRRV